MNPLFTVRDILQSCYEISAAEIAVESNLPIVLVEDVLVHWQHRGMVKMRLSTCQTNKGCSGCDGGCSSSLHFYQWCGLDRWAIKDEDIATNLN